jgi:NAD(P)-dependent dehydrogenase (short-subunit alcohol dehydrogenase family)
MGRTALVFPLSFGLGDALALTTRRRSSVCRLIWVRRQRSGVILMISSISASENYPNAAYKVTKAGFIAFAP